MESDPRVIWLLPACNQDREDGPEDNSRMWSEEDPGPCPKCGESAVKYIRADLASWRRRNLQ
jgi:hypothetical protein